MRKEKIEKYTYYTKEWDHYLKKVESIVQESSFLPKYHLYPKSGLMNDPNGLSYFNDEYQVFYQWFPFEASHGMKHWGHVTSDDLVSFRDEGYGIIPDEEYEKNGAYSGNAFEYDEKLYLFYTANYKTPHGKIAKQAMAIMEKDGTITKYSENPILDGAPEGFSEELRDPFVFERNGKFYMLLGGGRFTGEEKTGFGDKGELLLYQSDDLFNWEYQGTIDLPIDTGYMLECPTLVTIDGIDVLFLSPMGYDKETYRFQNRFSSIYLTGRLDLENKCFELFETDELDAGFDYYAPQSFYGKEGIPLSFGWFGCGVQTYPIDKEKWKHGLTMPQELSLKGNQLCRFPTKELMSYFDSPEKIKGKKILLQQEYYRLNIEQTLLENTNIQFGDDSDNWQLEIDANTHTISVDRSGLSKKIDEDYGMKRTVQLDSTTENMTLDIFVDNSFVEIYINKGEKVFSFRVFSTSESVIYSSQELEGTVAYLSSDKK